MHQLDHPRAMDQRSQAMSVAARAVLFERIIDILARQHRERVSGDTQRLNEQQTITDILRMLDYEEPAVGATSKAAPPRPAAQQPPQLQCPNGHGLVDFNTTTCAGAPAALGRQQSGEGQRPRRCRSRRRSDDEHLLEGAEASRVKPKRVCRRGRSQSHRDHSQSRCGGQDKSDHSQSASSRPRYLVPPAEWRKLPDAARELIVRDGRRKRQKRRRRSAAFRRATTRKCSASSRSSSRSSSSSAPAGDAAAAVAK